MKSLIAFTVSFVTGMVFLGVYGGVGVFFGALLVTLAGAVALVEVVAIIEDVVDEVVKQLDEING